MDQVKDYRVTVKICNNRILKAIESSGGTPGGKWCEANGLVYGDVNDLINMTAIPLLKDGTLSSTAQKLCDALNVIPDDLWSSEQLYPLEKNFSELELDRFQVAALLPEDSQRYLPDFSSLDREETAKLLNQAMSHLSKREREVLNLRFSDDPLSYARIAAMLDLSVERIRQIEAYAIRKLRNPKLANIYKDCLDDKEYEKVIRYSCPPIQQPEDS